MSAHSLEDTSVASGVNPLPAVADDCLSTGRASTSQPTMSASKEIHVDLRSIIDDAIACDEFSEEAACELHRLYDQLTSVQGATGFSVARALNLVRKAAVRGTAARLNACAGYRSSAIDMAVQVGIDGGVTFYVMLSKDADSLYENRRNVSGGLPSNRIIKLGPFFANLN
jgi:hypothetical protein